MNPVSAPWRSPDHTPLTRLGVRFAGAALAVPAILAAAHIFTVGLDPAYKALDKARWKLILDLGLGSLLVLYGWSVVSLILKLSRYGW